MDKNNNVFVLVEPKYSHARPYITYAVALVILTQTAKMKIVTVLVSMMVLQECIGNTDENRFNLFLHKCFKTLFEIRCTLIGIGVGVGPLSKYLKKSHSKHNKSTIKTNTFITQ